MTQNIDDLHERAGSGGVIHMHGELLKARCELATTVQRWLDDLGVDDACPVAAAPAACGRMSSGSAKCRFTSTTSTARSGNADLFVAIGTSGAVYPAAGFVAEARAYGVPTCEINLEAADNAFLFDDARYGRASETVPAWVEEMLER